MRFIAKRVIPPKVWFTYPEYEAFIDFLAEYHKVSGNPEQFDKNDYEWLSNAEGYYIFDMDMDEKVVWLERYNGATGHPLREIEKYFLEHGIRDGKRMSEG